MQKSILIFIAIILGCIFTFGHAYTYLIRYNLMIMLFYAFLNIKVNFSLFSNIHYQLILINITLPILLYLAISPFDENLALTALLITIIPTAVAAPVVAELLRTDIGKVTVSVLLTNPIIALILPLILTYLLKVGGDIPIVELVLPVLILVFVPLILSQLVQMIQPAIGKTLLRYNYISFLLFLCNLFIACGNASNFIQTNQEIGAELLFKMVLLTIILCVLQFQIGQYIGRKNNPLSFSLALGRKNTMLGLWLAITYLKPVLALGPICYIIIQNIYNSIQIWQIEK
jgi:BASS family bile acid:Na+ symporter